MHAGRYINEVMHSTFWTFGNMHDNYLMRKTLSCMHVVASFVAGNYIHTARCHRALRVRKTSLIDFYISIIYIKISSLTLC